MSNAKETTSYAATKSQTAAQLERSKRVSIATSVYSQHSQSTNDIPRITGNAPAHFQTWEQQNRVRINSGGALSTLYPAKPPTTAATTPTSNSGGARRILPSPASNKVIQILLKMSVPILLSNCVMNVFKISVLQYSRVRVRMTVPLEQYASF